MNQPNKRTFPLFMTSLVVIGYGILIYSILPSPDLLFDIDISLELFIWLDSLTLVFTIVAFYLNGRKD